MPAEESAEHRPDNSIKVSSGDCCVKWNTEPHERQVRGTSHSNKQFGGKFKLLSWSCLHCDGFMFAMCKGDRVC